MEYTEEAENARDRQESQAMVVEFEETIRAAFEEEIFSGDYIVAFALAQVLCDSVRNGYGDAKAKALRKTFDQVLARAGATANRRRRSRDHQYEGNLGRWKIDAQSVAHGSALEWNVFCGARSLDASVGRIEVVPL